MSFLVESSVVPALWWVFSPPFFKPPFAHLEFEKKIKETQDF
jgi:hypothetical protein